MFYVNCFKKQALGVEVAALSVIVCFCESRLMELSVWKPIKPKLVIGAKLFSMEHKQVSVGGKGRS